MANIAISELENETTTLNDTDLMLLSKEVSDGTYTSMKFKTTVLKDTINSIVGESISTIDTNNTVNKVTDLASTKTYTATTTVKSFVVSKDGVIIYPCIYPGTINNNKFGFNETIDTDIDLNYYKMMSRMIQYVVRDTDKQVSVYAVKAGETIYYKSDGSGYTTFYYIPYK